MTTPEQSPIERQEAIQGLNRRILKEYGLLRTRFYLSGAGFLLFGVSLSEKFSHVLPPVVQIGSGIVFVGGLAAAVDKGIRIWREAMDAHFSVPRGGYMAQIIEPLTVRLPPDEKRQLTAAQSGISRLLLSGPQNSGKMELEVQSDETPAVTGQRIEVLEFALRQLLDIRVIGRSPTSYIDRKKLIDQLARILAAPPSALGLTLTVPELNFLSMVINTAVMREKAPDTMAAYIKLLGKLIESYVLHSKVDSRAKALSNDLLSTAVRSGRSLPASEWGRVRELRKQEADKVVITDDQVIDFAVSMVALGNNRAPEARKTFTENLAGLKRLLTEEKNRLERVSKNPKTSASINTVLHILNLSSMDNVVSKETIESLNEIFGNRLAGKSRITPRDVMDEFKKTGYGNWSIKDDTIIVLAKSAVLVDILACAVVICYPHIRHIDLYVKDDKIVEIQTGVFYSRRLIENDYTYLTDALRKPQLYNH